MRTEQEVLKDFEALGYSIKIDNKYREIELLNDDIIIRIFKNASSYQKYYESDHMTSLITITEHKLLNELFTIWGVDLG